MIFTEWKLRKKAPWHCGPSNLLTATRRIADNVTKTFLTLLMQWQSLSLLLTATSLWANCMTADRVVWPQVSWWQSSFVSAAAQLYPGLPLFCRWASTFPGYLSTFPMHGFLQRQQVLLDVRESGRSMVLGCSPPLSSPNPAEAGKGTYHHHYYLHMACIHTTLSALLSLCCYDAETETVARWSLLRAKDSQTYHQTEPRPGKEPTTTIITFTWHPPTQFLVHCCLTVDMMLYDMKLDDQYWEPKIVKCQTYLQTQPRPGKEPTTTITSCHASTQLPTSITCPTHVP